MPDLLPSGTYLTTEAILGPPLLHAEGRAALPDVPNVELVRSIWELRARVFALEQEMGRLTAVVQRPPWWTRFWRWIWS
jgi:hypothetical protein